MARIVLKTVIVDDSDTQRMTLRKLIESHPNLTLVGDFHNGIVALNGIQKNQVDLILLDIEMPIVSGFDLLDSLSTPPQIILVSKKPDYALKAFDYNITDYLKKPIDISRFNMAILRAVEINKQQNQLREEGNYIYINSNQQKKKVFLDHLKWIEAMGDYIKLETYDESYIVLSTMKAFLKTLPENQFIRIHKSYIINVTKVDNWSSNKVEISGIKLPMSRNRKEELENLLITA